MATHLPFASDAGAGGGGGTGASAGASSGASASAGPGSGKRKLGRPRNQSRERQLTILSGQELGGEGVTGAHGGDGGSGGEALGAPGAGHGGAEHGVGMGGGDGGDVAGAVASGTSICTYLHPLTGAYCGTHCNRLYDLVRHRQIHAKEEARAVARGELALDQAVVWGKEVDPASSSITKEWACVCGSIFSRKDALLRHKRLRGH